MKLIFWLYEKFQFSQKCTHTYKIPLKAESYVRRKRCSKTKFFKNFRISMFKWRVGDELVNGLETYLIKFQHNQNSTLKTSRITCNIEMQCFIAQQGSGLCHWLRQLKFLIDLGPSQIPLCITYLIYLTHNLSQIRKMGKSKNCPKLNPKIIFLNWHTIDSIAPQNATIYSLSRQ